jgi:hypothetical protein
MWHVQREDYYMQDPFTSGICKERGSLIDIGVEGLII